MIPSKSPRSLWLPRCWRTLVLVIAFFITSFFLLETFWPAQQRLGELEDTLEISNNGLSPGHNENPTVNLVMATLRKDDISWVDNITIPNLNVIRYISDSTDAEFHPPVPKKGREAMIYLTYLHDYYDNLPDISIFIHADETPWHMESALNSSVAFALSHLDLQQVLHQKYFNLRVSWQNACPDWINTTKTTGNKVKEEQRYMYDAFMENFATDQVPEILAGPCCSQFAVTKDAVRSRPRSQYRKNMDWLLETSLDDYISGRIWEHLWQWLFKGEAIDCPNEWESYCRMYHVCFDSESRVQVMSLEAEKKYLQDMGLFKQLLDLLGGFKTRARLAEIDTILATEVENALERGKSEAVRLELFPNLYDP
ncbi:uncharacterized protein GGS25DRAFT_358154 [Hypoxylon fragiforme]|uniref:uncharacterized protein n=1 Tax=Hypoxylon fragiforme TaxID=63214 RepID=UPI0020C6F9E6|nr:uncharacterized protein GGS25DRAFT_358154 [Hypoxylon fragiforme]KAI2605833.1 hypothetical protein GGS25DRAFT_358154 [Hypoxylon fragiforme]